MSNYLRKIIWVLIFAALASVFVVVVNFCAPKIVTIPETEGEGNVAGGAHKVVGEDLTAVRIEDLGDLGMITQVNYVPGEFVYPGSLDYDCKIVDLTKSNDFAEKGSLVFVIMPLDCDSDDFYDKAEKLAKYKMGEWWQFTICIPKIFGASNIYLGARLMAEHGEIEGYDFIKFNTSYDKVTKEYKEGVDSTYINLQFYTSRKAILSGFGSAQIITIHYQSQGTAYSGIMESPIIGEEKAVLNVKSVSQDLLISFSIISAIVVAVFASLSVLEHTGKFTSAIIWVSGIALMLLSRFFLSKASSVPLLWAGFSLAASFIVLAGVMLAFKDSFGKKLFGYVPAGVVSAGALLAFLIPFVPFSAAGVLRIVCTVIKAAGAAALLFALCTGTILKSRGGRDLLQSLCAVLIVVAITASLFLPQVFPAQINSMFWLCAFTTLTTFVSVFTVFMEMKKSNQYLTDHLHMEVERQLKDIKAIIQERDNLLQFVSHDMKKPLSSLVALLETAIEREKDEEQIKTLKIIKQNDTRVVTNLSEIGGYAKFNYIAEPSQVVDLKEICKSLCGFHTFDCNANGINLKNLVDKSYKVYVKKQGLENAVSNLILNAVEHADCSTVTMFVKTEKKRIVLCVADNGKGVDGELDVFEPYVSEKADKGGVGLYICKSIIESMNGTLSYKSEHGATVFFISLLKA